MTHSMETPKRFRPNVCIVLTDEHEARVLVFHRVDAATDGQGWQFPQGGLQPGETPEEGAGRELREEIGTGDIHILRRLERPIRYAYPPQVLASLGARDPEKSRYQGQEQYWLLARLTASTDTLRLDLHTPEFDAFRWVTPAEAVEAVVPFKRAAYREALDALGLLHEE